MTDLTNKLKRAEELIYTSRHIALATVNEDGSPHNSPVKLFFDEKLENIYWGSNADALHSQNVLRTGQLFGVIYDRLEFGGVYLKCEQGHILVGKELDIGLEITNSYRIKEGKDKIPLEYYSGESVQKLWSARISEIFINSPVRDANGYIIKDERVKISKEDLKSL